MTITVAGVSLLLLLALASAGLSQPLVTGIAGEAVDGSDLTIFGTGFGQKITSGPFLWDTFESGAVGAQIRYNEAVIGEWEGGHQSHVPVYSSTETRAGSRSAYLDFVNEYTANLCQNRTFSKLYMSFWYWQEDVGNISRNQKTWRFYGDSDALQIFSQYFCDPAGAARFAIYDAGTSCSLNWSTSGEAIPTGEWVHHQVEYLASGPGESNGVLRLWENGSLVLNYSSWTRCSDRTLSQIRLGHYRAFDGVEGCPSNPGAHVYIDDVYMDESWARVMVGNAPTWGVCTLREIQIPTSWSNNEITITFNAGSYQSGDSAYLYVISETGVAHDLGFEIVVGGSIHDAGSPGPPSEPIFSVD